jgi:hypothetical protein
MSLFDRKVLFQRSGSEGRFIIDRADLKYFLDEEGITEEEALVTPISEATPDEFAELIGSELENENYHGLTSVADDVLSGLKEQGFDEAAQLKVMEILGTTLLSKI